jgi:V/A-type H+-transporting ATPase subunit D
VRRLEVARRGAEVLEQKRSTLLRERLHVEAQLAGAAADWQRASTAASAWNARATAATGPRALRLAALEAEAAAVTVTWHNILGVVIPASAAVEAGAVPGGSAAVRLAAEAHAVALGSAAALAALQAASDAIEAELRRTVRRLRAIEHRWIPRHEAALRRLELSLEESELADIARTRWAAGRQG